MIFTAVLFLTLDVAHTSAFAFVHRPVAIKRLSAETLRRRHLQSPLQPLQYQVSGEQLDVEHDSKESTAHYSASSLFTPDDADKEAGARNVHPRVVLPTPQPLPGDCDVKSYIDKNAKFYDGDGSFLKGPTSRTKKALGKFNQLLSEEREAGGVLSVDTDTPSTITSHAPGYLLSKEEDIIVGLQAEEPLRRTCKPHGGYGVVKKALDGYGFEPGEKLKAFKEDVETHNDLTFSMYTDEVSFLVVSYFGSVAALFLTLC